LIFFWTCFTGAEGPSDVQPVRVWLARWSLTGQRRNPAMDWPRVIAWRGSPPSRGDPNGLVLADLGQLKYPDHLLVGATHRLKGWANRREVGILIELEGILLGEQHHRSHPAIACARNERLQ
jgi:hypothetical protein